MFYYGLVRNNVDVDSSVIRAALDRALELTEAVPAEVRGALAAALLRWLLENPTAGAGAATARVRPTGGGVPLPETLVEALAGVGQRPQTEILVALLAYRMRAAGVDGLTSTDIVDLYREARVPRPQNLSDTIAKATRRGLVASGQLRGGQRTWRATALGVRAFESWLSAPP
jgi:hypothetical protein